MKEIIFVILCLIGMFLCGMNAGKLIFSVHKPEVITIDSTQVKLDRLERKINVCVEDHKLAGVKYNFEVSE